MLNSKLKCIIGTISTFSDHGISAFEILCTTAYTLMTARLLLLLLLCKFKNMQCVSHGNYDDDSIVKHTCCTFLLIARDLVHQL